MKPRPGSRLESVPSLFAFGVDLTRAHARELVSPAVALFVEPSERRCLADAAAESKLEARVHGKPPASVNYARE